MIREGLNVHRFYHVSDWKNLSKKLYSSQLSYIHCPDAEKETVLNELHLLYREGIFSKSNEISKEKLEKIRSYATFNVYNKGVRILKWKGIRIYE